MTRFILAAAAALALSAGHAAADGMPTYGKTRGPAPEARPCSLSANAGFSTETVIRGISESNEDFSVQGGFDLTCGRFYAGVAGTSVTLEGASALVDVSAGIRSKTGHITWDLGLIYHAYNQHEGELSFVEFKAGANAEIWRGGTLGATVFYAPEYGGIVGAAFDRSNAWTVEGTFAQVLPVVGIFTPTFSATVGQVNLDDANFDYTYWNVGLTLGFHERWAVDLRYSDTNLSECTRICDERFVASLKYTF